MRTISSFAVHHYGRWITAWTLLLLTQPGHAQTVSAVASLPDIHIESNRLNGAGVLDGEPKAEHLDAQEAQRLGVSRVDEWLSLEGLAAVGVSAAPDLAAGVQMRGFSLAVPSGTGLNPGVFFWGPHTDIGRYFVRDLATVDSVAMLAGADVTLGGVGSPAGIVQFVGKQPSGQDGSSWSAGLDSRHLHRVSVDLERGLGQADSGVRSRWVLVSQRNGRTQEGVLSDRDSLLWSTRWSEGSQSWRLELEGQRNQQPFGFGTVHAAGQFWYDQAYVHLAANRADRRYHRVGLYHDRRLEDGVRLSAWLNDAHTHRSETLSGYYTVASPNTLTGYWRTIEESTAQSSWGLRLMGAGRIDNLRHEWTLGGSRNLQQLHFQGPQSLGFTLNVANPDFSGIDPAKLTFIPRWWLEQYQDITWSGRDVLHLNEHWQAVLALSHTALQIDAASARTAQAPSILPTVSQHRFWGHTAGLAHVAQGQRQWLTRSQADAPNRGAQRNGGYLPPVHSVQHEAGWRWGSDGMRHTQLVAWRLEQHNIAGPDPTDNNYLAPIGIVRSDGLSLGGKVPWQHWELAGHGQYQRVRNAIPATPGMGTQLPGVAARSTTIRLSHQGGTWQPWLALQTMGRMAGDTTGSFDAPGYGLVHAGANWSLGQDWQINWSLRNVLNRKYIAVISSYDNVWQGSTRVLSVSAQHTLR